MCNFIVKLATKGIVSEVPKSLILLLNGEMWNGVLKHDRISVFSLHQVVVYKYCANIFSFLMGKDIFEKIVKSNLQSEHGISCCFKTLSLWKVRKYHIQTEKDFSIGTQAFIYCNKLLGNNVSMVCQGIFTEWLRKQKRKMNKKPYLSLSEANFSKII